MNDQEDTITLKLPYADVNIIKLVLYQRRLDTARMIENGHDFAWYQAELEAVSQHIEEQLAGVSPLVIVPL